MITILDVTIWSDKDNKKLVYKVKNKSVSNQVRKRYIKFLKSRHKDCLVLINTTENPDGLRAEIEWENKVKKLNSNIQDKIDSLKSHIIS